MLFFLLAALLGWGGPAASDSPELVRARQQLEIARQQAADGLAPAAAVTKAEEMVADASDQTILDRTLYGRLRIEDLTTEQAEAMVSAAERRMERIGGKLDEMKKLVDAGVAERSRADDLETAFAERSQVLNQAKARAALVVQMVDMAHAEAGEGETTVEWKPKEHVDGDHPLEDEDIREMTLAYEKHFREPFPVSARGETAVHRALGFDHTGRVDVALTPDSAEGVWLRKYLEQRSIPYYAFRIAIPGKATAPHIHIGPASTRLHLTD
jgi:hypothetical protein